MQERTAELHAANERLQVELVERKRMEIALRESEERFRSLIQNASDIITILEADGTIRYESPALEHVVGHLPDDVVGRSAFDFVHPDDIEPVAAAFMELAQAPLGASARLEFRFAHRDGSWRVLELIGTNLLTNPAVAGIITNARDITERKASEQAPAGILSSGFAQSWSRPTMQSSSPIVVAGSCPGMLQQPPCSGMRMRMCWAGAFRF